MQVQFKNSVEWEVDGDCFSLKSQNQCLELLTSDGQSLTLTSSQWQAVALGLSELIDGLKVTSRPSPARADAPNAGKPWDDDLDNLLEARWNDGITLSDAANEFGRTTGAISSRLERIGLVASREQATVISRARNKTGRELKLTKSL